MFIDCTDGTLARRVRVKEVLPQFDGSKLDDIVDYLNYALVPIVLVHRAGLLPAGIGLCRRSAAAARQRLRLLRVRGEDARPLLHRLSVLLERRRALSLRARLAALDQRGVLVALSVLVFVPIRYLYPSRTATIAHAHLCRRCAMGAVGVLAAAAVSPPVAHAGAAQPALPRVLRRAVALAALAHAAVAAPHAERTRIS